MRMRKYTPIGITAIFVLVFGWLYAQSGGGKDPRSHLIFNHEFHLTEVDADCEDCHQGAVLSQTPDDNLNPSMQDCAACHDVDDKDGCVLCHKNSDEVVAIESFRPNYQVFAHKHHISSGFTCNSCHAEVEKSNQWNPDQQLIPSMSVCLGCHREEGQTLECANCHYGKHPQPGDHTFTEWTRMHGLEAALDPEYFEQYFELGYCEDCHQGLNLKGEVHQPGWLFVHGDDAMAGGDCFVCHEDRTECSNCHRSGIMPIPHPLGDPTYANPQSGGEHKADAEAFFEACLSCHDRGSASPTCIRCH